MRKGHRLQEVRYMGGYEGLLSLRKGEFSINNFSD